MTSRNEFLGSISKALNRTEPASQPSIPSYDPIPPAEADYNRSETALLRSLLRNSQDIGIEVTQTSLDRLDNVLHHVLESIDPGIILATDDPFLKKRIDESALLKSMTWQFWSKERSAEESLALAKQATVGVAVAQTALAESGTVMVSSDDGSRTVTLVPESTIYIIPAGNIEHRLTQGMALLHQQSQLPASVHYITGPSATSDIELVRVVGVHGPVRVFYIIVNDLRV